MGEHDRPADPLAPSSSLPLIPSHAAAAQGNPASCSHRLLLSIPDPRARFFALAVHARCSRSAQLWSPRAASGGFSGDAVISSRALVTLNRCKNNSVLLKNAQEVKELEKQLNTQTEKEVMPWSKHFFLALKGKNPIRFQAGGGGECPCRLATLISLQVY